MSAKRKDSARISSELDDAPEITEEWIGSADLFEGKHLVRRGRPKLPNPKQLLSLRVPPSVIARWKATGPGWQTRMVEVLGASVRKSRKSAV